MGLDHLVDLRHEADGLVQRHYDLLVVGQVVVGEGAVLAVVQPLVADLVAADMKIPHSLGHAPEAHGSRSASGTPSLVFVQEVRDSDVLDL